MAMFSFHAASEADTDRLGSALAEALPEGAVVALIGTLGAGKTRLVKAIATACHVPESQITSPTYVLCHEYQGDRLIYHLDAYRLHDEDEFIALGIDEIFDQGELVLVEWADRVQGAMPSPCWTIRIEPGEGSERQFIIEPPQTQSSAASASEAMQKLTEALS